MTQRHSPWTWALATLLVAWVGPGCMKLDGFLFNPTTAPADANLMAAATGIPTHLIAEVPTQIVTADGATVNAYLVTHDPNDGTPMARQHRAILYCHGNSYNIDNYSLRVQALWQQGYNVLIFDYRGFGKTPGTPSEPAVYDDARAARAYLMGNANLNLNPNSVAFYGWSLGTAVCSQIAVELQPRALILESAFASVAEFVGDSAVLEVPRPWFADAQFDTRRKISQFNGDLLVIHGDDDHYVQPRYGQEVASAAQGHAASVTLWLVPGATHDTVPCVDTTADGESHGGCPGGFSDAYFSHINTLLDGALE